MILRFTALLAGLAHAAIAAPAYYYGWAAHIHEQGPPTQTDTYANMPGVYGLPDYPDAWIEEGTAATFSLDRPKGSAEAIISPSQITLNLSATVSPDGDGTTSRVDAEAGFYDTFTPYTSGTYVFKVRETELTPIWSGFSMRLGILTESGWKYSEDIYADLIAGQSYPIFFMAKTNVAAPVSQPQTSLKTLTVALSISAPEGATWSRASSPTPPPWDPEPPAVPEPSTWALACSGVALLAWRRRRS